MASVNILTFVEGQGYFHPDGLITLAIILFVSLGLYKIIHSQDDGPPSIPEAIPFVSNTYLFLTDMTAFIKRANNSFGSGNLVRFRLGPKKTYLLRGQKNVQILNRASIDMGSEGFMLMSMKNLWDMSPHDVLKFEQDKSGRLKTPIQGTESVPESPRYWAGTHHLYSEYLTRSHYANSLAAKYYSLFNERLARPPLDEWATVQLFDFLKHDMLEAATITLDGPKMIELNPKYVDLYWEFDTLAVFLAWSPTKLLNRRAYQLQKEFYTMTGRYWESAWQHFDWDGPSLGADWEGNFGSRFSRELAKWLNDHGFNARSAAGFYGAILFGLNSNTIPVTTWMLFHIIQDPSLLQAIRDEAIAAVTTDPTTGVRTIDIAKLVSLPLLQSIYIEVMRLHVSVTITRETVNPVVIDGHHIPKGAFVAGMTGISHLDEEIWGREGHPASEFWAARHIAYKEIKTGDGGSKQVPEISWGGRASSFFPYGGGSGICPGRHFAKQEILISVAAVITRFDIEFVKWTHMDGANSDREAWSNLKYAGSAALPPDRDMKIRWKRLW